MHDKPKGAADDDRATTAALDIRDQSVVLIHVLTIYPAHLRLVELIREVAGGTAEFEDSDRFERAARDLIAVGLLFASSQRGLGYLLMIAMGVYRIVVECAAARRSQQLHCHEPYGGGVRRRQRRNSHHGTRG